MVDRILRNILRGILGSVAVIMVVPVILTFGGSFGFFSLTETRSAMASFTGYYDIFIMKPIYLQAFLRSLLIAATAAMGSLPIAFPIAILFSKMRTKWTGSIYFIYIIVMIMPFQVTQLAQFILSKRIGIYDTPLSLILPGIFAPLAVFLLTQSAKSLPKEIIEAASLETSSLPVILWRVILPNMRTGLCCTACIIFTEQWNAVAEPLVLLEKREQFPLSVLLSVFSHGTILEYTAIVVMLVPPLILFMYFQDEIIDGIGEIR